MRMPEPSVTKHNIMRFVIDCPPGIVIAGFPRRRLKRITGSVLHKITLNEAGLYGLSDPPGWVGERALLSACELKALTVILGDRLAEAQRARFEIWLNRLFAQLIEDVQKPDRTRSRMDCWRRWNRGNGSGEGKKAPKLSTLVSDELKGLKHKISGLARAVEALIPSAPETDSLKGIHFFQMM